MRRALLGLIALVLFIAAGASAAPAADDAPVRPNIVFIMADDKCD
jgi:hypothetical protein